jgi:hypothetical protein
LAARLGCRPDRDASRTDGNLDANPPSPGTPAGKPPKLTPNLVIFMFLDDDDIRAAGASLGSREPLPSSSLCTLTATEEAETRMEAEDCDKGSECILKAC